MDTAYLNGPKIGALGLAIVALYDQKDNFEIMGWFIYSFAAQDR